MFPLQFFSKWPLQLRSHTFAGEVGSVAAQNSQGVVWRQRGLADGCDEGVSGCNQAQAAAQRGHGQLCLQDVLSRRLISAEEMRQEEKEWRKQKTEERSLLLI